VSDYPKVGFGGTCMIVYREDDKFVTYWYDENHMIYSVCGLSTLKLWFWFPPVTRCTLIQLDMIKVCQWLVTIAGQLFFRLKWLSLSLAPWKVFIISVGNKLIIFSVYYHACSPKANFWVIRHIENLFLCYEYVKIWNINKVE
jgi:hypothetical protein